MTTTVATSTYLQILFIVVLVAAGFHFWPRRQRMDFTKWGKR